MKRRLIIKEAPFIIWSFIAAIWILFPMTLNAQDIKLIVRGDDFGMTQGSLIAFEKGFNEGILTCGGPLVRRGCCACSKKS